MAVSLTTGAISMLTNGEWQDVELKPVLQVMDIRLLQTQNSSAGDRYRVMLSDGSFHQQGMLATQQNELVTSQKLQKGSIIQLTNFVVNNIRQRLIIIIVELNIILKTSDIMGDPKPFPQNLPANQTPSITTPSPPPPQPPFNQPPPSFNESPFSNQHPPLTSVLRSHSNPIPQSYTPPPPQPTLNNRPPPLQPPHNRPPPMYTNRGPVSRNEAPPRIIPISALNPYQGKWTIKARVTSKGELRRYHNQKGEGKVFSFDLLDSDGGEIRATCFNTVAENFYSQIQLGKVYYLSKGTLKPAQRAFNHLKNDFEITLDHTSTAQQCFEDDSSIPPQQFDFRPISQIEDMSVNTVLDVIGVVTAVNPTSSIMTKNGVEAQKRTLSLKDNSNKSIQLTLWGDFCNKDGQTLQELTDSGQNPILAVKSARVYEFNGKTLSTISSSQVSINPDFQEAKNLKTWFDTIGKNTPSISMSQNIVPRTDSLKAISQIKDEKIGTNEKADFITIKANIYHLKLDSFFYMGCPEMVGERKCSKKVVDNGDGKFKCERCDKLLVVDECEYRYILQVEVYDHSGMTWMTAFQETGEEIMGVSARDLFKMRSEDEERFTEIVNGVKLNEYLFKLKVKEESWNDELRVKCSVVKADKVNFSASTKMRLLEIEKMKESSADRTAPSGFGQHGA